MIVSLFQTSWTRWSRCSRPSRTTPGRCRWVGVVIVIVMETMRMIEIEDDG